MSSNRKSVIKKILGAEVNIKSIQKATAAKLAKVDAINKELEERKRDEDMESPAIAATVARIKLQNLLNKSDVCSSKQGLQ